MDFFQFGIGELVSPSFPCLQLVRDLELFKQPQDSMRPGYFKPAEISERLWAGMESLTSVR